MIESRYVEAKVDGLVQFQTAIGTTLDDTTPIKVGGTHDAVLHLLEFRLGPERSYWFGTAEVACTHEGIEIDAEEAGLPCHHGIPLYLTSDFDIVVMLNDGRKGLAKIRSSVGESEPHFEVQQVDFVGISNLE